MIDPSSTMTSSWLKNMLLKNISHCFQLLPLLCRSLEHVIHLHHKIINFFKVCALNASLRASSRWWATQWIWTSQGTSAVMQVRTPAWDPKLTAAPPAIQLSFNCRDRTLYICFQWLDKHSLLAQKLAMLHPKVSYGSSHSLWGKDLSPHVPANFYLNFHQKVWNNKKVPV